MGGLGSGNWHRWNTKETTEGLHFVDVRYLLRHGLLVPGYVGSLRWARNGEDSGSIQFVTFADRIVLHYRWRRGGGEWEDVQEPVWLTYTHCNYGGRRPWFICPGVKGDVPCRRRVAVLFSAGKYFLCRHCYELAYESQREDGANRALRRVQNIRRRLGGGSLLDDFPEKPKGMWWRTYNRLLQEAEEAELLQWASVVEWMEGRDAMLGARFRRRGLRLPGD